MELDINVHPTYTRPFKSRSSKISAPIGEDGIEGPCSHLQSGALMAGLGGRRALARQSSPFGRSGQIPPGLSGNRQAMERQRTRREPSYCQPGHNIFPAPNTNWKVRRCDDLCSRLCCYGHSWIFKEEILFWVWGK
jgi:hypothetical protein